MTTHTRFESLITRGGYCIECTNVNACVVAWPCPAIAEAYEPEPRAVDVIPAVKAEIAGDDLLDLVGDRLVLEARIRQAIAKARLDYAHTLRYRNQPLGSFLDEIEALLEGPTRPADDEYVCDDACCEGPR